MALRCLLGWLVVCFLTLRLTLRDWFSLSPVSGLCARREERGERREEREERGLLLPRRRPSISDSNPLPSARPSRRPSLTRSSSPCPPPSAHHSLTIHSITPGSPSSSSSSSSSSPSPSSWVLGHAGPSGFSRASDPASSLCVLLLVRSPGTAWRRRRRGGGV